MSPTSMTPERWQQATALFDAALAVPSSGRSLWLEAQCAGDADLQALIESMLEADADAPPEPVPARALLDDWMQNDWSSGKVLGAFRIVRKLGSGGMGDVYLAERHDGAVAQQVAIKRLRSQVGHAEIERRFLEERRILARLSHPHIAHFIDAGADERGQPYAVIEYVDGLPITEFAARNQLDLAARITLFLKVVDAVDHAHRHLVIHRDIKPGNVLVDASGNPRLLDFGIAKVLESDADSSMDTAFELRAFSLQHAAPEQLRGEGDGVSCDVYGLGVLLYELLTDRLPLDLRGKAYGEAEREILERMPPAPSRCERADTPTMQLGWHAQLRGDLDRIALHALKKSPQERYPTAAALAEDLRRHLRRLPISLRRDHRWYRLRLWMRRNPVSIAMGAALIVAVLVGAGLLYRQGLETAAERDQARAALDLMRSAFRAANPLELTDSGISAAQLLAAARPALQQRLAKQPRLYAELAATLVEVELAAGRGAEAHALAERAWEASQRDPPDRLAREALQELRARAALAAGKYDFAQSLIGESAELSNSLDGWLLSTRLLHLRGEHAAALASIDAALAATQFLDAQDERAVEARRLAVQVHRALGDNARALALADETLRWQRSSLPHDHPRILLTRLQRIGPASSMLGAGAMLEEARSLVHDAGAVFGEASSVAAAAHAALGSVLNESGDSAAAANAYAESLQRWRKAVGNQHQNTLRTAFNLAQMRAHINPSDTEAEVLYREVIEVGERTLGPRRHSVLVWRLALLQQLQAQGRCAEATGMAAARSDALSELVQGWLLDAYREHADHCRARLRCDSARSDRTPCHEADAVARALSRTGMPASAAP